jgi:uncharacterized protein
MAELLQNDTLLVGRNYELKQLQALNTTPESELVSITGRRRVGKTFLVKQVYNKELKFYVTGIKDGSKANQINVFMEALHLSFDISTKVSKPRSWFTAFKP